MAITTISDLFTPAIWAPSVSERMKQMPTLWASGVVARTPAFDAKASGEGVSVTMPFIKDTSETADEIQVEDTEPSINDVSGDVLIAPMLNRVTAFRNTALAAQVSGADPAAAVLDVGATRRAKQRQATLLSVIRGVMGTAGASAGVIPAGGCLKNFVIDSFDETGSDATSDQTFNVDLFIDACALMGELEDELKFGAMWIHPIVKGALKKADKDNWEKLSKGEFTIDMYRGVRVYTSNALSRAGTQNGTVYETYLFAPGIVGYGEKPQSNQIGDVSSIQFWGDPQKNNWSVYDRTRFLMLLNGTKWVGIAAGQSPTNAELQTVGNWELKVADGQLCGAVCVRTNA